MPTRRCKVVGDAQIVGEHQVTAPHGEHDNGSTD
jgi:hypothetical protein